MTLLLKVVKDFDVSFTGTDSVQKVNNFGKKGSLIAVCSDRDDSFVERYLDMDKDAD